MEIKNGVIIDGILYEFVRGEGENIYSSKIGKVKDILMVPEAIDLGLSVKWATCNIGARNPYECGDRFAWGEIKPKAEYSEDNCLTYNKALNNIAGNPQYDAATANWGYGWRMPTKEEIDEIINKCQFKKIYKEKQKGYLVIGPNGNNIFFPSAREYWSATPEMLFDYNAYASNFGYDRTKEEGVRGMVLFKTHPQCIILPRDNDCFIRPVVNENPRPAVNNDSDDLPF